MSCVALHAEIVQRAEDLGVAPEQPGDEYRQQREHDTEQRDEYRHGLPTLPERRLHGSLATSRDTRLVDAHARQIPMRCASSSR